MKVNTDHISQIARDNESVQKNRKSDEFGKLLEQEISRGRSGAETGSSSAAKLDMLRQNQLLGSSLVTSQNREPSFMNQMDSLLNMWENYAADMDSPNSSLKEVYASLQGISEQINNLKNSSSFQDQRPEIKSMIQELEVMTTTEVIKFNRGDYLS